MECYWLWSVPLRQWQSDRGMMFHWRTISSTCDVSFAVNFIEASRVHLIDTPCDVSSNTTLLFLQQMLCVSPGLRRWERRGGPRFRKTRLGQSHASHLQLPNLVTHLATKHLGSMRPWNKFLQNSSVGETCVHEKLFTKRVSTRRYGLLLYQSLGFNLHC